MSDVFAQLLVGAKNKGPRAELLETLGNQAANRFIQKGDDLNATIAELAAEHSNLDNEHLKRIAEFANNAVFQHKHQNDTDKNVHFDVADPGVIIRDLKDGGSPAYDGKTLQGQSKAKESDVPAVGDGDYRRPPGDELTADSGGFRDLDSGMAELFRQDQSSGVQGTGEPIAKTAAQILGAAQARARHANPIEDVYDTHVNLQAAREKVAHVHEQMDLLVKTAREDFYRAVKAEVLDPDGPGLPTVVEAVKLAAPSDRLAFRALRPVMERLVKEGAVRQGDMEKRASRQVLLNPEHPIVTSLSGLVKAAEEKVRAEKALAELDTSLAQTEAFLRSV